MHVYKFSIFLNNINTTLNNKQYFVLYFLHLDVILMDIHGTGNNTTHCYIFLDIYRETNNLIEQIITIITLQKRFPYQSSHNVMAHPNLSKINCCFKEIYSFNIFIVEKKYIFVHINANNIVLLLNT